MFLDFWCFFFSPFSLIYLFIYLIYCKTKTKATATTKRARTHENIKDVAGKDNACNLKDAQK